MARVLSFPNPQSARYRAALMGGDAGVDQTIQQMRQLIDGAITDAAFVRFVRDLLRSVPAHDEMGELEQIYNWVANNVRFVKDPVSKETLYSPQDMLNVRSGDCDDFTTLIAAMCLAAGYPAQAVTIAADKQSPNDFSHVFPIAECPPGSSQWIPLDAARPGAQFGVPAGQYSRARVWDLTEPGYQDIGRLGNYPALGIADGSGSTLDTVLSDLFPTGLAPVAQGVATDIYAANGSLYSPYLYPAGSSVTPAGLSTTIAGTNWLSQSSLIAGFPNWEILFAGVLVFMLMRRR